MKENEMKEGSKQSFTSMQIMYKGTHEQVYS